MLKKLPWALAALTTLLAAGSAVAQPRSGATARRNAALASHLEQESTAGLKGSIRGKLQAGKLNMSDPRGNAAITGRAGTNNIKLPAGVAVRAEDFLLQNERITIGLSAPTHASGNALTGGYIIDAFSNAAPSESLGQLHLYLDNTYPRMARFESLREVRDASTTDSVRVRAEGVDSQDPTIRVWQTYTLRSDSNVVEIETGVTPTRKPLEDFRIGDAFAWGATQQFLPGGGFESSGRFFTSKWVGGMGRGVAYGYFAEGGTEMSGPMGSTWIDTNVTTASARTGQTITSRRLFVVGHDLAEVYRAYLDESGTSYSELRGTVTEAESGRPAEGVRVNITAPDGTSVTQAVSHETGEFRVWLPAGTYLFSSSDITRTAVTPPATVEVPPTSDTPLQFQVASPAVLAFHIREETGKDVPCKVRLLGANGTPDPDLGPAHQIRTRNVLYLADGTEEVAVPAGDYSVVVSRGVEYNLTSVSVSLKRNSRTELPLQLQRAFRPDGVGADFHLHMQNSFDSAISLEDRVISCAGEGLQFIVATDHNYVTDLRPVIRSLGMSDWIEASVGNEITTREHFFGHFNAFPVALRPDLPGNGATPYEKVTAQQLMASALATAPASAYHATGSAPPVVDFRTIQHIDRGRVLQVNHPRGGDIGYFDRTQLNLEDGTTTHPNWCDQFTAIEVFNGKRLEQFEEVFKDWCNLLNLGYTYTATGNSDSHKVFDAEAGYPRNYVSVPRKEDLTREIVYAVNGTHQVLVTNGPYIRFTTKRGTSVGGMETRRSGKSEFQVKVEGADFVQPSSISFYGNGKLLRTEDIAETTAPVKWEGTFEDETTTDTWYTVVVRGTKSMYPAVNPLVEGNSVIPPVPLAFTNPIWIDRDGDGRFSGTTRRHLPKMREDRSEKAARQLDELTSQSKQRRLPRKKSGGES